MSPRSVRHFAALASLVCLTLAKPSAAAADDDAGRTNWIVLEYGHHTRPQQLTLALDLWADGAGIGAWYAIPVLNDGIVSKLNDTLYIEFGGMFQLARDYYYWQAGPNYYALAFAAGARWDFHLTKDWTVYAALKLGIVYGFPPYAPSWIVPFLDLGAFYALNDQLQLRMELGYPGGISLGLTFLFGKP